MMQLYSASQLREIHEERIAPFIKGNEVARPKKNERKARKWTFNLFSLLK